MQLVRPVGLDVVLIPRAPTHWSVEVVLAEPIEKNSVRFVRRDWSSWHLHGV